MHGKVRDPVTLKETFEDIDLARITPLADEQAAAGARGLQMLCVNTDDGIDITYSFQTGDTVSNYRVRKVAKGTEVPSIQAQFPSMFVFENEAVDLFGVKVVGMALDFSGKFYALSTAEPMTVISPEQKEAREKAAKIAAAKAAKAAKDAAAAAADGKDGE